MLYAGICSGMVANLFSDLVLRPGCVCICPHLVVFAFAIFASPLKLDEPSHVGNRQESAGNESMEQPEQDEALQSSMRPCSETGTNALLDSIPALVNKVLSLLAGFLFSIGRSHFEISPASGRIPTSNRIFLFELPARTVMELFTFMP